MVFVGLFHSLASSWTLHIPIRFKMEVPYVIFLCSICLMGLFCNVVIFIAFIRNPKIRTTSNMIFVSLVMADFFLSACTIPLSIISRILGKWVFGPAMCNFSGFIDNTVAVASIWTLALCTADRLCYIMYPLKYEQTLTKKRALSMILLLWVYSCILSVPPILGWNSYGFSNNSYSCGLQEQNEYFPSFFLLGLFAPVIIIVTGYMMIGKVARASMKKISSQNLPEPSSQHNIRSTMVVSAVIGGCLFCVLPVFAIGVIHYFHQISGPVGRVLHPIGINLFLLSSVVNPLIYGLLNKDMREACMQAIKCRSTRGARIQKIHSEHQANSKAKFIKERRCNSQSDSNSRHSSFKAMLSFKSVSTTRFNNSTITSGVTITSDLTINSK